MLTKNHNNNLIQNALYSIEISSDSGFCFGVTNAISQAEKNLSLGNTLYCLGDIVHNSLEIERLKSKGLTIITADEISKLKNETIIFRAHGEPQSSYQKVKESDNKLIDATCPVVLKIQQRIKKLFDQTDSETQIIVFGKNGHPEVIGLLDNAGNRGILIESTKDLHKIDFSKSIEVFSQTTKSTQDYKAVCDEIQQKAKNSVKINDTICRQVSCRIDRLIQFAKSKDLLFFVGGNSSSNAKVLFNNCKDTNENTFFVESEKDIDLKLLSNKTKIGICGGTSTPQWLMHKVMQFVDSEMKKIFI